MFHKRYTWEWNIAKMKPAIFVFCTGVVVKLPAELFMLKEVSLICEVPNDGETDTSDDEHDADGDSSAGVPQTSCGHLALTSEVGHDLGTNIGGHISRLQLVSMASVIC